MTLKSDEITYVTDEKAYKSFMTRGLPKAGDIIFTTEGPLPPRIRYGSTKFPIFTGSENGSLASR